MSRNKYIAILIIGLLISYQMVRIVVFVNEYGSVEHDGGWALGVSRSVAERGVYTSLTSTLVDPHIRSGLNYDHQFTIQDTTGREYFFIGNTMGPGTVLPNALILKLLGTGFWQSRLGPLLFFLFFLILASVMLYYLEGLVSVVILHLYLFFFPQIYIFLGYEALGEMPSMVYLLVSFGLFIAAIETKKRSTTFFFASGVLMGLAIHTRFATLIAFGGFIAVWFILYRQGKLTFKTPLLVASGFLLVTILWQLYVFISLMQVSSFPEYLNHAWGQIEFFYRSVKGITPVAEGLELFLLKAIILSEISYSHVLVSFLLVLVLIFEPTFFFRSAFFTTPNWQW